MSRLTRIILLVLISIGIALAQTNDECMDCHSDPSLTMVRMRGTISVCVTMDSLKGSPHEKLNCIDCHSSLKGISDFPHGQVKSVNCAECHAAEVKLYMEGFFKKLDEMGYRGIPACSDCHGKHVMSRRADTRRVCGLCHQAELKALNASVHGEKGDKDGRPLVCTSCHEPHFKIRRNTMSPADWRMFVVKGCMQCHKKEAANYLDSKHYQQLALGDSVVPNCITCHGDHNILPHSNPLAPTSVERLDNLCARCHTGYVETLHRKDGVDPKLMTCVACHTGHSTQMVRSGNGAIFRESLPETCNRCHGEGRHDKEILAHGKIMTMQSNGQEANCTECHVYHWKKQGPNRELSLRQQCQNCHVKENQEYSRSAHAAAREKGHLEAPTCITCHGEKNIKKVADAMRPQFVIDLCGKCHGNREFALKFQLNPDVVKSYNKTYHGQVYNLGYQGKEFATCINCHGNHDVRDPSDPASSVSRQNIVQTCARCHKDANEKFVGFLAHYDPHGGSLGAMDPNQRVSNVERFMNLLLFVVFGFFGIHTVLWFIREFIEQKRLPKRNEPLSVRWVQRFNPWQRFLHLMMMSSFLLLASTGLPLKFSHSQIAYWIATHLASLHVMAILHRTGAVMTFTYFTLHVGTLIYLITVKKEKGIFWGKNSLVPNIQDVRDLYSNFKWFFGLGKQPRFGRWTYWEKFDYMAVFWGVAVIGSSGLVLWFPEFFTLLLPGWMINLAHVVHSEEALLAVGFIFTVHFFNSHLRPAKFPMDPVIFTGRVSLEDMIHERPEEVARLEAQGGIESVIVPEMSTWRRRILLIIAWTGFTIGIILLAFILFSMIL